MRKTAVINFSKRALQEHEGYGHRDQGVRAGQRKTKPNIGHHIFDPPVPQGASPRPMLNNMRRERRNSFRSQVHRRASLSAFYQAVPETERLCGEQRCYPLTHSQFALVDGQHGAGPHRATPSA